MRFERITNFLALRPQGVEKEWRPAAAGRRRALRNFVARLEKSLDQVVLLLVVTPPYVFSTSTLSETDMNTGHPEAGEARRGTSLLQRWSLN
jgi:hypothetical protein